MIFKSISKLVLAASLLLVAISANAQSDRKTKYGQCMVFAGATKSTKNTYTFDSIWVKDTTIKVAGMSQYAIVIALNNTKKDKEVSLYEIQGTGEVGATVFVTVIDNAGGTTDFQYPLPQNGNPRVVIGLRDGYPDFSKQDPKVSVDVTNLCGKTDHFKVNYQSGGKTGALNAVEYVERTNDGCKKNIRMKSANFIGDASSISVSGGNIVFSGSSSITLGGSTGTVNNGNFILIGRGGKGSSARYEIAAFYNPLSGNVEAMIEKGKIEKGFTLSSAQFEMVNFCKDTIIIDGEYNPTAKTSFAILLNGIQRPENGDQCYVLNGKVKEGAPTYTVPDLAITNAVSKDPKTGEPVYSIEAGLNTTNDKKWKEWNSMNAWYTGPQTTTVTATLRVNFRNSNEALIRNINTVYDNSTGNYIFKDQFKLKDSDPKWGISSVELIWQNLCGDSFVIPCALKSGADVGGAGNFHVWTEVWNVKQRFTDACASDIDLKKGDVTVTRVSGLYALSFAITPANNTDIASVLVMNVKLVNCKGEAKYIDVKMTYDTKAGKYTGALGYYDENNCKWKCEDLTLKVYNECGNEVKKDGYPVLIQKMKDKIAKGDV